MEDVSGEEEVTQEADKGDMALRAHKGAMGEDIPITLSKLLVREAILRCRRDRSSLMGTIIQDLARIRPKFR